MERFYPLVIGRNGEQSGDSAGRELKGLNQWLHVNGMTARKMLEELLTLQIRGDEMQFSKARAGKQPLTLPAEVRIMGICSFDSITELTEPHYDEEMAEKIKRHRDRVASDDAYQASILKKREEDNIRNAG